MRRVLFAATALMVALAPIALAGPAAASSALPADPAAHGYIGLCDETGHNVTGGDIDTKPFIWKAVSSTAPPSAYQGAGQNAVLNAYQPRPQVPAAEWSGLTITSASFYKDKPHPAVQSTYEDDSLADFVQAYPPLVNGLYVLRMYYGKANYGLYNRTYPTTTIQVVGKRWSVVSGGTVNCGAATAVSNEQLTGVVSKKNFTPHSTPPAGQTIAGGDAKPAAITKAPAKVGAGSGTPSGAASASSATGGPAGDAAPKPAADSHSTSSSDGWVWFVIVPVAVVLLLAVLLWRRRSSSGPTIPPSATT